ncbi:MAG: hypothetical protein QXF52_10655 [Thermoproteota archaeon]
MMRKTSLSIILIAMTLLVLARVVLTDADVSQPALYTDKDIYMAGETVVFSGEGYLPGGTYSINITQEGTLYAAIVFTSTQEGLIPSGVEWDTPGDLPSGLYEATVYNTTDPGNNGTYMQEVANASFTVNATILQLVLQTDKQVYTVEETVVFSGAGYVPSETSYLIEIEFEGEILATLSFLSQTDGTIPPGVEWAIPFDAPNGTYVANAYNDTEPNVGILLASTTFQVNASSAAKTEAMLKELEALKALINADVGGINVSLIQRVIGVARKINQFASWIEEEKNKTAANMLNAAKNKLRALIHHVEAQKGKHIDEETADQLIQQAQSLIEKIDETASSMKNNGKGKGKANSASETTSDVSSEDSSKPNSGQGKGNSKGKGKGKGKGTVENK